MSKKIVVAGITGNIGSKLAHLLAEQGHQVIGIGRDKSKLNATLTGNVDFRQGELQDVPFLTSVLKDADAAFLLIPPQLNAPDVLAFQREVGEAIAQAVKNAGIRYVVNLSSQAAQLEFGTGPILGVHDQELRLNQVEGLNVLHLRPSYFMENLLNNIPMVQQMGIMGSALRPDLSFPWIATQDIAQAAAEALNQLHFQNVQIRDLLGPRDLTMTEATRILGQAIGKLELPYVQFPYEDARQGMIQAGLSASMADLYVEMSRSFNEGHAVNLVERTPENTTPTTLEQWVAQLNDRPVAVA